MGRYYRIEVTDPSSGNPVPGFPITSLSPYGFGDNLAALDVQLDIPLGAQGVLDVTTTANLQIAGIPISWISQANSLVGKNIKVFGGMSAGLPLANPSQRGLLIQGQVYQAFANWQGTAQTLNLFITQLNSGTPNSPVPHLLYWPAGTLLSTVITNLLKQNYPSYKVNMNISSNLVLPYTETGFYPSLTEYVQAIKGLSQSIMGRNNPTVNYLGVDISLSGNTFYVSDGTSPSAPKVINFQDMIGQPTWIANPLGNANSNLPVFQGAAQVQLVMRGDLQAPWAQYVQFPPNLVSQTFSGGGNSYVANGTPANVSIFQGTFQVYNMRHVGWYRSVQAGDWITVLTLLQTNSQSPASV